MNIKHSQIIDTIRRLLDKNNVYVAITEDKTGFIIGTEEFVLSELDQTYVGKFDVYITGEEQWPSDPNSLN